MIERWLPVPGYEGIYDVSDLGRVRRVGSVNVRKLVLNPVNGYQYVSLSRFSAATMRSVHSVVAQAFLGNGSGREVDHIDHVRHNNAASNLRYVTSQENKVRVFGEAHGAAKLTDASVREIRASADSLRVLALRFGVSKSTVKLARQRSTWAHIG